MATKHVFATGPLALYCPTGPNKGAHRFCYNENEVAVAKQDGFTTTSYVHSKYPVMVFQAKTGKTKPIGKLGDTDEHVAGLIAALGPDWGLEHVPEPDPVEEKPVQSGGTDTALLIQLVGQMALLTERINTAEAALVQSEEQKIAMATRLAELEAVVAEPELVGSGKKK